MGLRSALAVALAVLCVPLACGRGAPPAGAADAVVAIGDLPKGIVRCSGSGTITAFMASVQTRDPETYRQANDTWLQARGDGAVSGAIGLFSSSTNDCEALHDQPSGQLTAFSAPLMMSVALQFADEASAQRAYANNAVMGLSVHLMERPDGPPMTEGAQTGLGANSIVVSGTFFGAPFYEAIWQYRTLTLELLSFRIDVDKAKKIVTSQQARIKNLNLPSSSARPKTSPIVTSASGVVGRPVELDVATVTVTNSDLDAPPATGQPGAAAGHRLVYVAFHIVYKKGGLAGVHWTLIDSSLASYSGSVSEESMTHLQPHAGDTYDAKIYFEVPKGATGLTLTVEVGPDQARISLGS